MTQQEFIAKWQPHIAGLALCGSCSEMRDSPLVRGSKAMEIPEMVRNLLKQMFNDAAPAPTPPTPPPMTTPTIPQPPTTTKTTALPAQEFKAPASTRR